MTNRPINIKTSKNILWKSKHVHQNKYEERKQKEKNKNIQ